MINCQINLFTHSASQTHAIGQIIAQHLKKGDVVALSGHLGAGKTTLTSGIATGLNINQRIISPTFNIMRMYHQGKLPLYHIDAYRLEQGNADLGLEEFIEGDGVSVIEWPQYLPITLNENKLTINFLIVVNNLRHLQISGNYLYWDLLFSEITEYQNA